MQILKDVVSFIVAVLKQWAVLMGGVIMIAIALFERGRGNPISPKIYWPIIMGFIAIAVFLAWRKEREQVVVLSGAGILTASVKELVGIYNGRTNAQGDQLAKTYKGKLMKFSGSIYNISEESSPFPFMTRRSINFDATPGAFAYFTERWNGPISALNIGDELTVIGKIRWVTKNHIALHRCEIVEVRARGAVTPPPART